MADSVGGSLGYARYFDLDAPELRERRALRRIISQQILRAQFVADFAEGLVELRLPKSRNRYLPPVSSESWIRACSPPVSRPALLSMGTMMMRVHNRFRFFRGAHRLFVVNLTDRVSAVGDQDDDFSPLAVVQSARGKINRVDKAPWQRRRGYAQCLHRCVLDPKYIRAWIRSRLR